MREITALQTAPRADARIAEFAASEMFDRLFREGMGLVEEAAAYLDGDGRRAAKRLERSAALAYASESMRLTTRLMQAASWLLVQRAVREGEMSITDARDQKYRLGARDLCTGEGGWSGQDLPARLSDLLSRSRRLYERVLRLDAGMYGGPAPEENPVTLQLAKLQAAFGADARAMRG